MIRRIDPYTGEVFYPKRNNQYFANRQNQIAYNNQKAKEIRDLMANIDNHIRNNWKILVDALKENKFVIRNKDYLLGCGYNFNFFHFTKIIKDEYYFGIYNYGITLLNNGLYKIIKFRGDE
ncbi:MAG: hypothetical protein K9I95_06980 [Flavobacteriaceae bacterium]|nr:hypothetical protein [Flavobacteriaceae bacterium]